MNKKNHTVKNSLSKVGLMLLYACFFWVQFSFNYDIANIATPSEQSSYSTNHLKAQNSSVLTKAENNQNKKVNIRLNKRYQPVSYLSSSVITVDTPTVFLLSKISFFNTNSDAYSTDLTVKYLRGPPAVA